MTDTRTRKTIVTFLGVLLLAVLTLTVLVASGVINIGGPDDVSVADDLAGRCGDGVIQAPNLDGIKEMCDGDGEYCTNNCTIRTNRKDGVCRIGVVSHHTDVAGRIRDTQVNVDNGAGSVLAYVNEINSALGPGSAEMVLIKPPQVTLARQLPYPVRDSYTDASYRDVDILLQVDSNLSNVPPGSTNNFTGTNQRVVPVGVNPPQLTQQLQGVANIIKANQLDGMHTLLTGDHGTFSGGYTGDVANIFASTVTNAMNLGFNYQTPGSFFYVSNQNRTMPQLQTFGAPNFLSGNPVFYTAATPAGDAWTPGLVTMTGTGPGQCYYTENVRSGSVGGPIVGQTCLVGYVPPIDKGDGTYSGYVVLDAGAATTVMTSFRDILKSVDDCNPEALPEIAVCGDSIVQNPNDDGFAEECDDGNTVDDDECSNTCTVPPLQQIAVEKSNSVVTQGLDQFEVEYTIVATNPNSVPVTATVTDNLPDGPILNANTIQPAGGSFQNGQVVWLDFVLQPGENTFNYTLVYPASTYGTTHLNTVTVTPEDPEIPPTTDESTVTPDANTPTVGKTGSYVDGTVTENGATIVYRVNANNLNNFPVTFTVADQPDSNVIVDVASVNASGGSYDANTNTITWSNINFGANESIDFEYYATLPIAFFGQGATNTASLPGIDTPPVTVTVPPLDVNAPEIIKDYDGTSVVQNQNQTTVNYSLFVSNPNDFNLTVNVTDQLESGVTASNISNNGVQSGTTITWPSFVIPANDSTTLTYTITIPSSLYNSAVDNIATVTAPATGDSDTDDETITINIGSPTIEKSADTPVLDVASSTVGYSIVVSNPNNFQITVDVNDVLDSGVTVVAGSISNGGTASGNTINWNDVTVPANGTLELTYQIEVPASYYADPETCNTGGTDILNTATVVPQTGTPASDDHTLPALCVQPPYLSDKAGDLIDIDAQSATYNYTLEVRNDFDQAFDDLDITDTLPNGVVSVTNISNGGVWNQGSGVINWNDLSIGAGPNTVIQLTYTIEYSSSVFGQDLVNTATMTVDGVPGDPVDNTENPDPNIDAAIYKSSAQTVTEEGTVIDYSIRVTNIGDVNFFDYTVVDTFDTDIQSGWVTNIGAGPNGITGILEGNTITWSDIDLNVGEEIVLMYRVRIPRDVEGVFDNVAVVYDETDTPVDESSHSVVIIIVTEIIEVPQEIPVPTPGNPTPTPVPSSPRPTPTPSGQIPDTAIYDDPIALALIGLSLTALGFMVYKIHLGEKLNFDGVFRKAGLEGYASGVDERVDSVEEKEAENDKEYVPKD